MLPAGCGCQWNEFPRPNLSQLASGQRNPGGAGANGTFTSAELAQAIALDLSGPGIRDLTGIEHSTALEQLDVKDNRLTELDVSQNTRLRALHCATNALTRLDALILAVAHDSFRSLTPEAITAMFEAGPVSLMDIKGFWDKRALREAGFDLWRL